MSDLLNSASLVMIPSGYKEDVVYSQIPTSGSGDLSFTRASNGTRVNSAGLVEVCPWNLLDNSNGFTSASWVLTQITSTSGQSDPLGGNLGWRFNETTANDQHRFYYGFLTFNTGVVTQSIYVKSLGRDQIFIGANSNSENLIFTFSTETISSVTGFTSTSATNVGNGWYRISGTFIGFSPINCLFVQGYNGGLSYAGDTAKGFYAFGGQVNYGSTAKPYFPTTDRLNVPRLTYQNGGGGCPSLLLEKQSTNTLSYSQDFTDAIWLKGSGLSVTGNTTTSPDGTQNAGTITNTATSNCFLYQLASTSATTWTMSLYAKKGTNKYLGITLCSATYQATSRYQPVFNLDNGTLQTINQSGSNETNTSYSITAVGDGWYRLTATATFVAGADQCYIVLQSSNNTSYNPASGNLDWTTPTTGNYYLWGAQGEAGSYPTSYIPTTSASATRVADACFKTGISSLIGQTEGTMFIDTYVGNETDEVYGWLQASLSGNPNDSIQINRAGSNVQCQVYVGSTAQGIITGGTITKGQRIKVAVGYKQNDLILYLNGTQIGTDTSTDIPTCAVFQLGAYPPLPNDYTNDGGINQAVLFKTRLTNAELASLTTL